MIALSSLHSKRDQLARVAEKLMIPMTIWVYGILMRSKIFLDLPIVLTSWWIWLNMRFWSSWWRWGQRKQFLSLLIIRRRWLLFLGIWMRRIRLLIKGTMLMWMLIFFMPKPKISLLSTSSKPCTKGLDCRSNWSYQSRYYPWSACLCVCPWEWACFVVRVGDLMCPLSDDLNCFPKKYGWFVIPHRFVMTRSLVLGMVRVYLAGWLSESMLFCSAPFSLLEILCWDLVCLRWLCHWL